MRCPSTLIPNFVLFSHILERVRGTKNLEPPFSASAPVCDLSWFVAHVSPTNPHDSTAMAMLYKD